MKKIYAILFFASIVNFTMSSCESQSEKFEKEAQEQMKKSFNSVDNGTQSFKIMGPEVKWSDDSTCVINVNVSEKDPMGESRTNAYEYIYVAVGNPAKVYENFKVLSGELSLYDQAKLVYQVSSDERKGLTKPLPKGAQLNSEQKILIQAAKMMNGQGWDKEDKAVRAFIIHSLCAKSAMEEGREADKNVGTDGKWE